ncbi:hypothetical protein U1Q18_044820 [Sarracenia purpurea var. burkii]
MRSFLHSKTRANPGPAERASDRKTTCCRGPLWTQLIGLFELALAVAQRGRHKPLRELSSSSRSALIYSCALSLLLTAIETIAIAMLGEDLYKASVSGLRPVIAACLTQRFATSYLLIKVDLPAVRQPLLTVFLLQRGLCQATAFVNMPLRSSERPQLYSKLGSGGFGQVHRAHFRGSVVSQKNSRTLDSQPSRVYLRPKSTNHRCLCFPKLAEVDEASPHYRVDRLQHTSGHAAGAAGLTLLQRWQLAKLDRGDRKTPFRALLNAQCNFTVLLDMQMNVKLADFGLAIKLLPGKCYSRDFAGVRKIRSSFAAPLFEHLTDAGHAASLHCLFRPSSIRRRRSATIGRMASRRTSFRSASQPMSSSSNSKLRAGEWQRRISSDLLMSITSSLREYYILMDEKVVKNADLQLELHKIPEELRGALSSMLAGPVRSCEDFLQYSTDFRCPSATATSDCSTSDGSRLAQCMAGATSWEVSNAVRTQFGDANTRLKIADRLWKPNGTSASWDGVESPEKNGSFLRGGGIRRTILTINEIDGAMPKHVLGPPTVETLFPAATSAEVRANGNRTRAQTVAGIYMAAFSGAALWSRIQLASHHLCCVVPLLRRVTCCVRKRQHLRSLQTRLGRADQDLKRRCAAVHEQVPTRYGRVGSGGRWQDLFTVLDGIL